MPPYIRPTQSQNQPKALEALRRRRRFIAFIHLRARVIMRPNQSSSHLGEELGSRSSSEPKWTWQATRRECAKRVLQPRVLGVGQSLDRRIHLVMVELWPMQVGDDLDGPSRNQARLTKENRILTYSESMGGFDIFCWSSDFSKVHKLYHWESRGATRSSNGKFSYYETSNSLSFENFALLIGPFYLLCAKSRLMVPFPCICSIRWMPRCD